MDDPWRPGKESCEGVLRELATSEPLLCSSPTATMGPPTDEPENLRLKGPRATTLLCCTLKGMENRERLREGGRKNIIDFRLAY